MKIKAIAAVCALTLLGGCAQVIWDKAGATKQDYATDTYECERDVRQSGYYGGGLVGAINAQEFGARCMQARGWTARQAQR